MTHRRPVEWDFPLYQDDDQPRLAELANAVSMAEEAAKNRSAARLGDAEPDERVEAAKQAYNAFVDEVAERTFVVRLRVIGSRRFRDLLLEHPPRMVPKTTPVAPAEGETAAPAPQMAVHDEDRGWGVDTSTFPRALIGYKDPDSDVATIVSPVFKTDAEREAFIDDELSDGELVQMWIDAHERNRGGSVDPKFLPRYANTPTSDET